MFPELEPVGGHNRQDPPTGEGADGEESAHRGGILVNRARARQPSWQDEALACHDVSREFPCSALNGETVLDSLPATPKSPPDKPGSLEGNIEGPGSKSPASRLERRAESLASPRDEA